MYWRLDKYQTKGLLLSSTYVLVGLLRWCKLTLLNCLFSASVSLQCRDYVITSKHCCSHSICVAVWKPNRFSCSNFSPCLWYVIFFIEKRVTNNPPEESKCTVNKCCSRVSEIRWLTYSDMRSGVQQDSCLLSLLLCSRQLWDHWFWGNVEEQ